MALSSTRTRLFTAGTDGKVKEGGRTHGAVEHIAAGERCKLRRALGLPEFVKRESEEADCLEFLKYA